MPRLRLDPLDHHAAENVRPAVVFGDADAGRPRGLGKHVAIRFAVRKLASRSMPAKRANASATVIRSGAANGSARAAAKAQGFGPGGCGGQRQEGGAVIHQRLVRFARAVPFQQREFRMVQRAALAVAKYPGELEDPPLAGRQQLLAGELRRGAQIERRGRAAVGGRKRGGEGVQVRLVAGRDLQAPVSTSMKSRASNQARSAATIRPRASRIGRRSA